MTHVKVCGITSVADALACAELGVNALGLNFVPSSPRCIPPHRAIEIARAVKARTPKVIVVGVVADLDVDEMVALRRDAELDCLQLHGDEPPAALTALLPHAYKALRVSTADDVEHARRFGGDYVLVDAHVPGVMGGTGTTFEWSLVKDLARERRLTLAGGLRPDNVARAIEEVAPFCLDVASSVERAPGIKDLDAVRAFVAAANLS